MSASPILIVGAGRMGAAMIEGWIGTGAFSPTQILVREPYPTDSVRDLGVVLNPPDEALIQAQTVLMAVKPQIWTGPASEVSPYLAADAVIVSIAAGIPLDAIVRSFDGRRAARVMPTTAVAIGKGAASIYAPDTLAHARAHELFDPVATTVDLTDETLIHAATGVSGSAPAYLYAFIEALEAAGATAGLSITESQQLARAAITGAAALLDLSGADPAALRAQVVSPGGTTQAALDVLMGEGGFGPLLQAAVAAAAARSRALAV